MILPLIPRSNALNSTTSITINPSMYIAHQKGEIFTVTIDVANVNSLTSYGFKITYNNSLLSAAQVSPGSFFPPLGSHFTFYNNTSTGSVQVNCSLNNPSNSVSGSGTLASIAFKVVSAPTQCLDSPLKLGQTSLLDSKLVPIVHDSVGAVYFWKSAGPDPPADGRLLDLYTQKGGMGSGQPDGIFTLGEQVDLISQVTYNNQPVQSKLVAFQVLNPHNQTIVIRTAITDQDGFALISFKIPNTSESVGTWTGISVVDIAQEVVWDTITFQVTAPVGGFSVSIKGSPGVNPLIPYNMVVFSIILVSAIIRRKAKHGLNLHAATSTRLNEWLP